MAPPLRRDVRLNEPALTRTCRQVRAECLPIYYGGNNFAVSLTGPFEERLNDEKLAMLEAGLDARILKMERKKGVTQFLA